MSNPNGEPPDPIIDACLDRAMEAWDILLPPEDAALLRRLGADFLASHPVAAPLVERLRANATPDASGPRLVADAGGPDPLDALDAAFESEAPADARGAAAAGSPGAPRRAGGAR